jgi:hypothetical protein
MAQKVVGVDSAQEREVTPDVVEQQIRFALSQLRVRNAHHQFEDLCRHFAQARISRNVLPATGPVSAGGDQGRDFETFRSYIADQRSGVFVSEDHHERAVFICTLQARGLQTKIKNDVAKAVVGGDVDAVYAFCEADLPAGRQHQLEGWARAKYALRLAILDGRGLSAQLASSDLFWIAERFLALPAGLQPRGSELRRYLEAARKPASLHPYMLSPGLSGSPIPALATVYQHQAVVDRTQATADAGPNTPRATESDVGTQTPLAFEELLKRHRHVLLLGGPGLGKSSLLRHFTAAAATAWLKDRAVPYIPVIVHARHLASGKPLAEAIRDGAVGELASKLTRGLPVSLFESEPQPGLPWLVLVDGMDEVQDPARRAAALRSVVDGCGQRFWRFVIASRPLPAWDLAEIHEHCGEAELLPFDSTTVIRFAGQWFEQQKLPDPHRLAKRLLSHMRSMSYNRNVQTPLTAAMLCWLLSDNPDRALPMHRFALYRTYIDLLARAPDKEASLLVGELQAHSLSVLTKVAYRRQADYDDTAVLAAAIAELAERSLRPAPHERRGWERTVHDALCQTGLVVPSGDGELTFIYQTIEEYLAACHLTRLLAGLDDFARSECIAQFRDGDLISHMGMLSFLGGIWVSQGYDLDPLAAELLDDSPVGALELIRDFVDNGLPLKKETATRLESIATDWQQESADRLLAATIMAGIDPPASSAMLLALTIDPDMDDSDRVAAIEVLQATNPTTAAPLCWLMWFTDYGHLDAPYKGQANQLLTEFNRQAETEVPGLQLLVNNRYLPDRYRAWAGVVLVGRGVHGAYEVLKSAMATRSLISALGELLEGGDIQEAWAVLRRLSRDRDLPSTERMQAAEELAIRDGNP